MAAGPTVSVTAPATRSMDWATFPALSANEESAGVKVAVTVWSPPVRAFVVKTAVPPARVTVPRVPAALSVNVTVPAGAAVEGAETATFAVKVRVWP